MVRGMRFCISSCFCICLRISRVLFLHIHIQTYLLGPAHEYGQD